MKASLAKKCHGDGKCSGKKGFKCAGHDALWGKKPPAPEPDEVRRALGLPTEAELEKNARRYGATVYLRQFGLNR
jgi:hypothetical protein